MTPHHLSPSVERAMALLDNMNKEEVDNPPELDLEKIDVEEVKNPPVPDGPAGVNIQYMVSPSFSVLFSPKKETPHYRNLIHNDSGK